MNTNNLTLVAITTLVLVMLVWPYWKRTASARYQQPRCAVVVATPEKHERFPPYAPEHLSPARGCTRFREPMLFNNKIECGSTN